MPSLERKAYAMADDVSIYRIAEEDRKNYVELKRQLNGEDSLFINPRSKDTMWQMVIESTDVETYSIFYKAQYCGSMELQNIDKKEPEIGIDLLEEYRNIGIGPKAIMLLAKKEKTEGRFATFAVRILKENSHSQHVFQKLGATKISQDTGIPIENETTRKVIDTLKDIPDIRNSGPVDDFLSSLDKEIVEYRLYLKDF